MSEHTYFYQALRHSTDWSAVEPSCGGPVTISFENPDGSVRETREQQRAHCWHSHWRASMNSLNGEVPRARDVCCFCASLREQRPNLDAHGPHHPDREKMRGGAYWNHESGQLAKAE